MYEESINKNLVVQLSADGVEIQRENLTHVSHEWEAISRSFESPEYFLLYLSERLFIPLPKRAMSAEDQIACRNLLIAHTAPKQP
jgi:hypothetical protein